MKAFILALALSSPAALAGEQYYCGSNYETEGKTLLVRSLSHPQAVEGEKMEYLVVVREGAHEIFAGKVDAEAEDVQLFLRSRAGQKRLVGTIYMDELDQTSIHVDGEVMNFDCRRSEF